MKTFAQIFFENNVFIINSELFLKNLKYIYIYIWTDQLAGLLRNLKIHIEFHSKLFTRTKNGLKNEMVKLSVIFFLMKP
jgi:hypothetical protein